MKFCPNCGTQLLPGAKFCPSCGFRIPLVEAAISNASESGTRPVAAPPPRQNANPRFEQEGQSTPAGILSRIKGILLMPDQEWALINDERPDIVSILVKYVLILALIPAICLFVNVGLIGESMMGFMVRSISGGIMQGLIQLFTALASVYLLGHVVNYLAPQFSSVKDMGRSVQLIAYSFTPMWVLGVLYLLPSVSFLKMLVMILGGLYAIFLMYKGLPIIMKTPPDKIFGYLVVTVVAGFLVMLVVGLLLGLLLGLFMARGAGMG
jgi:hypothetical protein